MKIIDILKQNSELLGLSKEIELLNTATEINENEIFVNEELSGLLNLFRYSLQELCTNYVPLSTTTEVEITNNKYELSNINNFIRVQCVCKNNNPVNYKIINRAINVEENGKYTIQYATYPNIESVFEDINYLQNFSPDVLVLGLASYYTLSRGRFDEFKIFHDRYLEKAENLKELKSFCIPQRRWE